MSVFEVRVQMALVVEAFPAKATRPLRLTVLLFGCLLETENVSTGMQRTLDAKCHMPPFQHGKPFLHIEKGKKSYINNEKLV